MTTTTTTIDPRERLAALVERDGSIPACHVERITRRRVVVREEPAAVVLYRLATGRDGVAVLDRETGEIVGGPCDMETARAILVLATAMPGSHEVGKGGSNDHK